MWLSRVTGNEGLIPEREPERSLPHLRMAAGAKITQFQMEEVVNSRSDQKNFCDHKVETSNISTFFWRASLVPAAAVIPAPIMYAKIAAVEKSVVSMNTQYYNCVMISQK